MRILLVRPPVPRHTIGLKHIMTCEPLELEDAPELVDRGAPGETLRRLVYAARQADGATGRREGVAAVDQGTNSIRLLVVEPDGLGGSRDLARDMVITRLGRGVDETGRIAPEALRRTVDVLAMYCRRARALHAERIRVGATSAVRDARNRDAYERAVLEHAGSRLEVITGEHEATLSFLGATAALDVEGAEPPYLVLDIGGGSTELIIGALKTREVASGRLARTARFGPPVQAHGQSVLSRMEIEEAGGAAVELAFGNWVRGGVAPGAFELPGIDR